MADSLTLAVSNRAKSSSIKRLPPTVDVTTTTTIEEVQQQLAKKAGVSDYNRIGIFDPVTRKIIRDRRAVIGAQENVVSSKALLAQDLGMIALIFNCRQPIVLAFACFRCHFAEYSAL